jgi:hypothetical protein
VQLALDLQIYALRREQGRLEEVVDVVEQAVDACPANPVCRYLEDTEPAAELYGRLRPYARRNAVLLPELCRGPVSRGLGMPAGTMAQWDDAARHFEDALK